MTTMTRRVHAKRETSMFSRKDEDFGYFPERFEARLHLLKLRSVLLDSGTLPAAEAENVAAESEKLKEKTFEECCELGRC